MQNISLMLWIHFTHKEPRENVWTWWQRPWMVIGWTIYRSHLSRSMRFGQFTLGGPVNSSCANLAKYLTKQVRSKAEGCCSIIKGAGSSSFFIASFNCSLFFSFCQCSFRAAATITSHVCESASISNFLYLWKIKMRHVLKVKYSLRSGMVDGGEREKDKPTL